MLLAAKLGVQVAARQLKDRIRGILLRQWANDRESAVILLIVAMKVHGEIKASRVVGEIPIGDGVFEQADSFLLRAAGDAHEEAQHLGNAAERIYVIVVKAEAQVGIS